MSADEMPCGCEGHADNAHLCRYPELEAALRQAEREREETLRMWREYKTAKDADAASADDARERAEADNAAKDKAFAEYAYQYGVDHLEGCPEDDTCECPLVVALNEAFSAGHPGAAMLERMRALEELAAEVRQHVLHGGDVVGVKRALAVYDALKVPHE